MGYQAFHYVSAGSYWGIFMRDTPQEGHIFFAGTILCAIVRAMPRQKLETGSRPSPNVALLPRHMVCEKKISPVSEILPGKGVPRIMSRLRSDLR